LTWGRKTTDPTPLIAARTGISARRIRQLIQMSEKDMRRLSPAEAATALREHKQIQAAEAEILAEIAPEK
jgi:hypothetical protein